MASKISIVNMALVKLGADPLTSLEEDNDRAVLAEQLYESTRDAVLEAAPWRFATKRVELAKSATDPAFGFDSQFALPSDSLRILETDNNRIPWQIENGFLMTNRGSVKVRYIFRVVDENKFSPLFIEAFAERLAAEFAMGVTGKPNLKQLHQDLSDKKVKEARTMDSQAGTPRTLETDDLLVARLGGFDEGPIPDDSF